MKRFLCALLCALMLLTAIPFTAYADTEVSTYQQLWQAVYSNENYITFQNDIKYTIPDGGNQQLSQYQLLLGADGTDNITVDLNGYTLSVTNTNSAWLASSSLFHCDGNSSLNVINGSIELRNYNCSSRTDGGIFEARGNSHLTITNVDAVNKRSGKVVNAIQNSTVNLEGGSFTAMSGFAVWAMGESTLNLDKNVTLTTADGSGVVTQFGNAGQGSLHSQTPNLTVISATFKSGVEVLESNISAFAPTSSRYVFVEGKQYNSAFGTTKSVNYYWAENTGGYALIDNSSGYTIFAKNLQVISRSSKQYITVENGTASPNYAAYGDTVTITAKNIAGKDFSYWLILKGGISMAPEELGSSQTTFTMGADAVKLRAVYDNGYERVNSVDIKLAPPTYAGSLANATTDTEGVTVGETWWIELYDGGGFSDILPENYTFEAGHTYRAGVNLATTNSLYFISDDVSVTFIDPATGAKTPGTQGATRNIWICEYTIPELSSIDSLTATVNPDADKKASTATVTAGGSTYTVTIDGWYKTDNVFEKSSANLMSGSGILRGGYTYVVGVKFTPKYGYKIASLPSTITINGENGLIGEYSGDGVSRVYYAAITVPESMAVPDGWQKNGSGYWMYFKDNAALTGWQKISNVWYYFDSEGTMQTGWQKIDNVWYYFNASGAMVTGWQKIGGSWYYFKSGGQMAIGWQKIGSVWYYFKSGGQMQTGWQKISGKWYYFATGGAMQTGWQKISGKWYYFESSGAMRTANLTYKGKVYRFNSSGACLNP